ncbi:hypothetical protein [Pseudomonas sputi]|uniref:hypothetical protein n=1 Tax=Pseudomonas sputi TaxID=2892325 RepID=UPI001F336737|nr:hypothetical protein [Pseudomonas sputi]
MNSKAPFNDAAREKDVAEKQRIAELQQERDRRLQELKEEQKRRRENDMEKARQQILLKHNRPALKPDDVRTKPLTAEQLEERTCRVVEAQNLKELNAIREHCKRKIAALENPALQHQSQAAIERTRIPHEITKIFNGIPKDRDSQERER